HPRQSARHHAEAIGPRGNENAQRDVVRHHAAPLARALTLHLAAHREHGRLRDVDHLLGDKVEGARRNAACQRLQFGLGQVAAEHRPGADAGVGWLHDQLAQMSERILAGRGLPAPPGGDRGHPQLLTEQALAQGRQV
ncbi:hypothetical protein RZS08_22190, partial [Arthrospira platensis SPKY1]|nr:hypothetical protein [Arthrospira platensis SPKY1]